MLTRSSVAPCCPSISCCELQWRWCASAGGRIEQTVNPGFGEPLEFSVETVIGDRRHEIVLVLGGGGKSVAVTVLRGVTSARLTTTLIWRFTSGESVTLG